MKKRYKATCTYVSVCKNVFLEEAITPEKAKLQAKRHFHEWNEKQVRVGGNNKELINIKVVEA